MVGIVDDTELPWGHTVDLFLRMDDKLLRILPFERRGVILGGVTDLESYRGER